MVSSSPLVSAVIPTRGRPDLVPQAVASALAQTLAEIEVIVVLDGADPATTAALDVFSDPRLRVVVLPERRGVAAARNAGVAAARGPWIAFLDDDDQWLPRKLALQIEAATSSATPRPIIACRVTARNTIGDHCWPRRAPREGEPVFDWLFCRRTPFYGEGLLQVSMILTSRELLREFPFDEQLTHYEDFDWLMNVTNRGDARLEFVPYSGPLVLWGIDDEREHLSAQGSLPGALAWVRTRREHLSPRAYASFILLWAGFKAAHGRIPGTFTALLREAWRDGAPAPVDLVTYLGHWLLPSRLARRMAVGFGRAHQFFRRPPTS